MSETPASPVKDIVEREAARYYKKYAGISDEKIPPLGGKEVTLEEMNRGPRETALSLASGDPNEVIKIKNAADTVEPQLLADFMRFWSHKVADRSFPTYKGTTNAEEIRYKNILETSKDLTEWLQRTESRIDTWEAYDKELKRIKDACQTRFRAQQPRSLAEVEAAFATEAEKAPDGVTRLKDFPHGTLDETDEDARGRAKIFYDRYKTIDPLGFKQEIDKLVQASSQFDADDVVIEYIRLIAETRVLAPTTLLMDKDTRVDDKNFRVEDALRVCVYNAMKPAYAAILKQEIKDVAKYVQDLTRRNREYAWQIRVGLINDLEMLKQRKEYEKKTHPPEPGESVEAIEAEPVVTVDSILEELGMKSKDEKDELTIQIKSQIARINSLPPLREIVRDDKGIEHVEYDPINEDPAREEFKKLHDMIEQQYLAGIGRGSDGMRDEFLGISVWKAEAYRATGRSELWEEEKESLLTHLDNYAEHDYARGLREKLIAAGLL